MLGLFECLVEMPVLGRLHGFFKINMVCLVSLRFVDSFFPPDSYAKSQTKINMVCLVSLRFVDSFFPPDSYAKSQTKINANAMHLF